MDCSAFSFWTFDPFTPTQLTQEHLEIADIIAKRLQNEFGLSNFSQNMLIISTFFSTHINNYNCGVHVLQYLHYQWCRHVTHSILCLGILQGNTFLSEQPISKEKHSWNLPHPYVTSESMQGAFMHAFSYNTRLRSSQRVHLWKLHMWASGVLPCFSLSLFFLSYVQNFRCF